MSDLTGDTASTAPPAGSDPLIAQEGIRPRFLPFPFAILLIGGVSFIGVGLIRAIVGEEAGGILLSVVLVVLGAAFFVAAWFFFRDRKLGYALALILLPILAASRVWDHEQFGSPGSRFPWFELTVVTVAWLLLLRPSVMRYFWQR